MRNEFASTYPVRSPGDLALSFIQVSAGGALVFSCDVAAGVPVIVLGRPTLDETID